MGKKLQSYLIQVEERLRQEMSEEEKHIFKEDLLTHIRFFQHERLIHLIVTATFALLAILSILASLFSPSMILEVLILAFIVLLCPYIWHYYLLENGVQKLYTLYDKI